MSRLVWVLCLCVVILIQWLVILEAPNIAGILPLMTFFSIACGAFMVLDRKERERGSS